MGKLKNIAGEIYNNLKVIEFYKIKNTNAHWICECLLCNSKTEVSSPNLRSGNTKDCGCMKLEKIKIANMTHGKSKTPTWKSWFSMRRRMRLGKKHSFIYGEIKIDDKWNVFDNFLKDMGERPIGMTIDRIDNKKGYFKDNCKWSNQAEQNRNRSTNVILNFKGKSMCATDWATEIGVHRDTIRKRIKRGLPIEKVLEH